MKTTRLLTILKSAVCVEDSDGKTAVEENKQWLIVNSLLGNMSHENRLPKFNIYSN